MAELTLVLAVLVAPAADPIDNVEFQRWAKFKPGTSIAMTMVTAIGDNTTEMVTVTTLKSVSGTEAVVETTMTMSVAGQKIQQPARARTIPAKIEKVEVAKGGDTAPEPKTEEADDEIEACGKKLKCRRFRTTIQSDDTKTVSTSWLSDSVPGGMVKMESETTGAFASKTTNMLTAWEAR